MPKISMIFTMRESVWMDGVVFARKSTIFGHFHVAKMG